ncbi:MAG TPA: hypothetical protein IGR64_12425 [Leptolyngbyaceae cyanobacterium M65_K2018_010]|nr:hypothetical protein [Leptolyngbyaceae cyanobacterium M65_K2018_010]
MLSSLLDGFRQHYPKGSLVSELLTIHDGRYLVRVIITVEGTPLSTGLAAQDSLEAAEDLATQRAMERLGLSSGPSSTPANPAPLADSFSPAHSPQVETASLPPLAATEAELAELAAAPLPQALETRPQAESGPHPQEENGVAEIPYNLAELDDMTTASVDLSDIIAQTDVELQRLGWGVSQGREFLEKTYGKRSRHDLTDEELLEFLLFLETQPSPAR